LKSQFSSKRKIVDLVCGSDAYKDLPNLLAEVEEGRDTINVIYQRWETPYGDISPVRLMSKWHRTALVLSLVVVIICMYICMVPLTRGRERSREQK
jgi:tRNA-2-methylthio-N6-dimethylallyladenosine synthase